MYLLVFSTLKGTNGVLQVNEVFKITCSGLSSVILFSSGTEKRSANKFYQIQGDSQIWSCINLCLFQSQQNTEMYHRRINTKISRLWLKHSASEYLELRKQAWRRIKKTAQWVIKDFSLRGVVLLNEGRNEIRMWWKLKTYPNIWQRLTNSVTLVRERTIQTERLLLVGEVSANFCG
jgi:hypothetical protein